MTVTGKSIGQNIDDWDMRSEKCTAWAGLSAYRVAPRWCSIRQTSWVRQRGCPTGTWRPNRCCSSREIRAPSPSGVWHPPLMSATLQQPKSRSLMTRNSGNDTITWKGAAEIEAGLKAKFADFKGMVRAELGSLKQTPVLVIWQYEKGGEKKIACLVRTGRLRGWQISKAYHEYRPGQIKETQPCGLMPYDSAFRFDAQDCIRNKDTAYSPTAAWRSFMANWRPRAAWSRRTGLVTPSRPTAARASSSKGRA